MHRLITLFCCGFCVVQVMPFVRLTNFKCVVMDESLVTINECRLRAYNRSMKVLSLNVSLQQKLNAITMNMHFLKKSNGNGYQLFLYNFTFNSCEFLVRRNNPVIKMVYDGLQGYTNINHPCPYEGDVWIKDFELRQEYLKNLPVPVGEYALVISLVNNLQKVVTLTTYAECIH